MDHSAAVAAATFLRERLADPVTVPDLADHMGYSPAHCARGFSREMGVGPAAYLASLRFHAAKTLLLTEDLPVVDVCTAVGFSSPTTFTRRFAQAVGVAPGRFRALADAVAESELSPFSITPAASYPVVVRWRLPATALRRSPLVWLGWYPKPVPIGLPHAGRLVAGSDGARIPLCPGAPWLLAFTVAPNADIADHLAPSGPLVAGHPSPLGVGHPAAMPREVLLRFRVAAPPANPMLSALPALHPATVRRIG